MGQCEIGQCDICQGGLVSVARQYYKYDIKCECCNSAEDNHFEVVWYCKDCAPKPPEKITCYIKPIEE